MNEKLLKQQLDDYKPFIKTENWDNFVKRRTEDAELYGGLVKREKVMLHLSDDVYEYVYTYADGMDATLTAVRMGLIK